MKRRVLTWIVVGGAFGVSGSCSAQFMHDLSGVYPTLQRYSLFPQGLVNPFPVRSSTFANRYEANPGFPNNENGIRIQRPIPIAVGSGDTFHFSGGVSLRYKGYDISGDEVFGNRKTQVFIVNDHALFTGADAHVAGNRVIIDFGNQTYQAFDSSSTLMPSLSGGFLLDKIYVRGLESNGTENEIFVNDGSVTSCGYEHPHYEFDARSIDFRPNKRIIFRHLDIRLLGKRLISLPFLSIPTDRRDYNNLPAVGQDPAEGYFIKTRYGIPLSGNQDLAARFDEMTKVGQGLGLDYAFNKIRGAAGSVGDFRVYGVPAAGSFDFAEQNAFTWKSGQLSIQNTYANHDYLSNPNSVTFTSQAGLNFAAGTGQETLTFYRQQNSSIGFSSTQQNIALGDTRTVADKIRVTSNFNLSDYGSSYAGTTTDNRTLNVRVGAEDDLALAIAKFNYQRTIPIGGIQSFIGTSDRTPELTLETDSRKLFDPKFGSLWPIRFGVGIGQFFDSLGSAYTRDTFNFNFNKATDPRLRTYGTVNTQFTQSFYSDNTAQYALGFNGNYRYRLGSDTAFNFYYNYLKSEGYTPLPIDHFGRINQATADLSFRPIRIIQVGAQSGYDGTAASYGETAWQPIGLRLQADPTSSIRFRSSATYDTTYKQFANLRFDLSYKPGATFIGFGARYDAIHHVWADANGLVQAFKWGRLKTDLLFSYDGYSKQFSSRQVSFTYDLHDADLIFQIINNQLGFNPGTSFALYLRLKVLPFDTGFGTGNQGQPIGLGTGLGY